MIRIFTSRACLDHVAPGGFPERPERLVAILDHLAHHGRTAGTIREIDPDLGTIGVRDGADAIEEMDADRLAARIDKAITDVHDPDYVERFRRAVERGDGLLDSADNPLSPGTWKAARAAVAAGLAAADWVSAGEGPRLAFVAARPPGHHAEHARAMGFCYVCTVAVLAQHLRVKHRAERVAIYDLDIHHGNGTQHLFEERPDVLYASTHQYPFYPGTGAASETGIGAGAGTTVNAPLPAGAGDDELLAAVDETILPALEEFDPDLLLLSSGFDAWQDDPLGGFRVGEDGFRRLGERLGRFAAERTDGRVLVVLEGGYDVPALGRLAAAHLDGLADGLGLPAVTESPAGTD